MTGKKLLVFSDSHGSVNALKTVFNLAKERLPPDDTICAAACCGDGLSDLQKAARETGFYSDWKLVCGNNDYGYQTPDVIIFDFADRCFFMCHGHRFGIYGDHQALLTAAKTSEADVALFGHTHVPFYQNIDGILLVNPGSVSRPRSRIGATFSVIECIEDEPPIVRFYGIGINEVIREVEI